jgi:hypothetical protein
MMSIINENGVGIRNIQPRFYNCGCEQYIIISLDEVEHHIFNPGAIHLAMHYGCFYIRADPADMCLNLFYILYPVMYKEDLPVP